MEEARQAKRRIQLPVIGGGGGGIEGLVVWGGALAVASLVAVFTFRKGRKNDDAKTDKDQPPMDLLNESGMKEGEDAGGKALLFVIPETHSTMNENSSEKFYEAGVKEIDPSECVPNWNSIPEENALRATRTDANGENKNSMGGHQEILLSDTEQESIAISEDYCVAEEFPLPVPDSESEGMSKNGKEGSSKTETFDAEHVAGDKSSLMGSSLSSVSSTDEEEEDSPIQSSMSSMISSEEEDESSAIQSILSTEEGKEDNDENDRVTQESEESLEGTHSTSMKFKMEEVWPAEIVEVLSSEFKGMDLSNQIPGERHKQKDAKTGEYCYRRNGNNGGVENMRMIKKKETLELATKRRMIWVNSILVLMLLFLLAKLVLSFYLPSDISTVIL